MPHDLFGDVVVRPPAVRSRRSTVVLASVAAHAAAGFALAVAQLLGVDVLPVPHQTLAFTETQPVRLVDIDLPARPGRARQERTARASRPSAAPVAEPATVAPEPEPAGAPASNAAGSLPGIERSGNDVVPGVGLPAAPPAPPPAVTAPLRLHSGIQAPRRIGFVAPAYPALARSARVEGVVIVEATIGVDGTVSAAHVLRSIPLLDAAALDAVRQWRFAPALLNGVPVPVIMTVTVNFSLDR